MNQAGARLKSGGKGTMSSLQVLRCFHCSPDLHSLCLIYLTKIKEAEGEVEKEGREGGVEGRRGNNFVVKIFFWNEIFPP